METTSVEALQIFISMAKIDYDIIHFTYITYESKTSLSIKYNLYIVLQTISIVQDLKLQWLYIFTVWTEREQSTHIF